MGSSIGSSDGLVPKISCHLALCYIHHMNRVNCSTSSALPGRQLYKQIQTYSRGLLSITSAKKQMVQLPAFACKKVSLVTINFLK